MGPIFFDYRRVTGKKRWGKGGDSLQQGQGADLNHEFYCTVSAGTETGIVYIYI